MKSGESIDLNHNHGVSRRTVAKGIAWAAPAITVAGTAPAFAISIRKDPGINGWVNNELTNRWGTCNRRLVVNSNLPGTGRDGAPFGLYLYDIEDSNAQISGAKLTYWILGSQTNVDVTSRSSHSPNWVYTGTVGQKVKDDGLTYTGYRWEYVGEIPAEPRSDGRVWLGHFHVQIDFTQQTVGSGLFPRCQKVNYWTQREITVDRDGPDAPKYSPEYLAFERRNGADGPWREQGQMRMASAPEEASVEQEVEADVLVHEGLS